MKMDPVRAIDEVLKEIGEREGYLLPFGSKYLVSLL